MNSSMRQSIKTDLFFILKYHIYAFFYFMKIFPEQCFYFDKYVTDSSNNTVTLPTLYSTFIADEKNSIQEWLLKLEELISEKKLLKFIINCYNPCTKNPIKQLVVDLYDNDKQTLFNKNLEECVVNEIKNHKFECLLKVLKEYKGIKINKSFYDIKDAVINMKFVYKNRNDVKSSNESTQSFKKKNYTGLNYEYTNYCIHSKINTFKDQKMKSKEQSFLKKRKIIYTTESLKKKNSSDYVYSEIEESDLEEAVCNETSTKINDGSQMYLSL